MQRSEPKLEGPAWTQADPRLVAQSERGRATLTGRMFLSFRNPAFRLFFAAMMGQMGAMNMQMVARSWFMYELTGSAVLLGTVALANGLPIILFSLYGGVIADQIPKKYVLVVGQAASALLALGVALLISLSLITWGFLLAASVLQGVIMALMMPSRQAVIAEIVGEAGLTNAVALNTAGMNMNRLLAPGIAGLLIALIGIEAVYYFMAGLYLIAVLFVLRLPITGSTAIQGGGALQQVFAGLRYIQGNSVLPALLLLTLVSVLFSMPYMMLMPMFTTDIIIVNAAELAWLTRLPVLGGLLAPLPDLFAESSFRLGVLMTVSGIGALAGSLAIAVIGDRGRGRLLLLSSLLLALTLMAFSFSPWYFVSLALAIPLGLGQAGRMALGNALVQAYTVDAYRGRVMSIYLMEFGVTNFGIFGISIIAAMAGVQWAIGGAAAALLVISVYYLAFIPAMRRLD